MINLIPNEEKKKMSKDFYFRLLAVFFSMLGVSVIVASISILPSYLVSSMEKDDISKKLTLQQNEQLPSSDQNNLPIIEDLKNKLGILENVSQNNFVFSKRVINETILSKSSSIKITEISYQNEADGKKISISGTAPSREALLSFRRALEDNAAFSKVDLPVSNFVKGSNIKFNLSLIPS